ncbi:hypothetical protein HMPREF1620_03915 [Escherichia coli 909945-2]|nr:hypothetical protein HMPREF1620_03915 [Escherichia coli 909945-2]
MNRFSGHRRHNAAVEHAALFRTIDRNIAILIMFNGITRQYGVAVMPFRVYGIATVGKIAPHSVGEKLVVRGIGPVFHMQRMNFVRAHHFLQANNIGADGTHGIAKFRQNEASVKRGKAFVNIDGEHLERKLLCLIGHNFPVFASYLIEIV